MRYRPPPDELEIVRDELRRVRRELDRLEGIAAGLERALLFMRMSDAPLDSAPPAEPGGRQQR